MGAKPDDAIDPAVAAQAAADMNQRMVERFAAEARRLGLTAQQERVAWEVFDGLRGPFRDLMRDTGLHGMAKARVARLAAFMTLGGLETVCEMLDLYGAAAEAVNDASKAVLERRAAEGGGGPC